MSSRVQIALVKQLNRQLRIAEQKENQRLHRELRHRVRQFKILDDHFDEQRDEIVLSFENYRGQIEEAMANNKTRFELGINQKLETIIDEQYIINHQEYIDDDEEFAESVFARQNSHLFFKGLYPTNNNNSYNNDFYWFLFASLVYMSVVF